MDLTVEFQFCAAHQLPKTTGRCRNLHGHNYRLAVTLRGEPDPDMGWLVDFDEITEHLQVQVIDELNAKNLNDFIDNPTAEVISLWIWERVAPRYEALYEVRLWETPSCSIAYRGPDRV